MSSDTSSQRMSMNGHGNVERAAGGLVIRQSKAGLEVLLIDDAYGHVTFPKGHLEAGETWEDAAIREIREETGIEARILAPLGRVEYPIQRNGESIRKQVRLFLLEEIDEADEPTTQVEEIRHAYFLPWNKAEEAHAQNGYANWTWIFKKALALWTWHSSDWESRWRTVSAALPSTEIDGLWAEVRGTIDKLLAATAEELSLVAPDIWESIHGNAKHAGLSTLPLQIEGTADELRGAIEHTLLKPEASAVDIDNLCGQALSHQFKAVCVNPIHVQRVSKLLAGSSVIPCTVVGFPLGAADLVSIVGETANVVRNGALDVDMVLPIGAMREDDIWTVYEFIKAVCTEAHKTQGISVKVIFENHFLTYSQVAMATILSIAAGADFVKTSTGFAPSGAKLADVALMAHIANGRAGVKAAGGIRTKSDAIQFLRYGANRLGTSSGTSIIR